MCSGSLSKYKSKLEEMLANGINTEGCKYALEVLEKSPPEAFHPSLPQMNRARELEALLQAREKNGYYKFYKEGIMRFTSDTYYILKDGILLEGPQPLRSVDEVAVGTQIFQSKYLHYEDSFSPVHFSSLSYFGTIPPTLGYHYYSSRVRAASLDIVLLPLWNEWKNDQTATGLIRRREIMLVVAFCVNGNALTQFNQFIFMIVPSNPGYGWWLGGPLLRALPCQGTALTSPQP
ncbi:hypothetical protein BDZ91DRAFT_767870 [Kalaharituber pfeilii]|nr:hypothetical protein BDZ91DRAFT_767870 [Kalaharituber pfeilii]